jgi:proton-dependent oligopeptide transporter, POT family
MGLGYLSVAMGTLPLFFAGLFLVATGNGFLKPNISTIVGNLYRDRPHLRDSAFNIFYMGINIGAFLAPLGVAWLRARYGWHAAFASSAVGMVFALLTFVAFNRHFAAAARRVQDGAQGEIDPPPDEARRRTVALLAVFAIAVAFWIAFYQNGFTLTFWARDFTDRVVLGHEISPETFQSVNPLGIILFSPLLVLAWGWLRDRGAEPSTPAKIMIGILFTTASFGVMGVAAMLAGAAGRVSPSWLVGSYLLIAMGEICLSPMGLSLVSRVAPPKRRGLLMGGWFVATSIGGYFSGFLGTRWGTMPHAQFFLLVTVMTLVAAGVLALITRWLRPVFARAEQPTSS